MSNVLYDDDDDNDDDDDAPDDDVNHVDDDDVDDDDAVDKQSLIFTTVLQGPLLPLGIVISYHPSPLSFLDTITFTKKYEK